MAVPVDRYKVDSDHTCSNSRTTTDLYPSPVMAWLAAAVDYGVSDHGADPREQANDTNAMSAIPHAGTYVTHDGITFIVRRI